VRSEDYTQEANSDESRRRQAFPHQRVTILLLDFEGVVGAGKRVLGAVKSWPRCGGCGRSRDGRDCWIGFAEEGPRPWYDIVYEDSEFGCGKKIVQKDCLDGQDVFSYPVGTRH